MSEYNLNFYEAIKKCLLEGYYIKGEHFKEGFYFKNRLGTIVMMDGLAEPHIIDSSRLAITEELIRQKYKVIDKKDSRRHGKWIVVTEHGYETTIEDFDTYEDALKEFDKARYILDEGEVVYVAETKNFYSKYQMG